MSTHLQVRGLPSKETGWTFVAAGVYASSAVDRLVSWIMRRRRDDGDIFVHEVEEPIGVRDNRFKLQLQQGSLLITSLPTWQ
jgi:hypothetical protein